MNLIRNMLLVILLLQFSIFLYVKLVYEEDFEDFYQDRNPNIQQQKELETLVHKSVTEIIKGAKELPQSSEYTLWDKEMIANLNKEIESYNNEIDKIATLTHPTIEKEKEEVEVAIIKTTDTKEEKTQEEKPKEIKVVKKEKKEEEKIVPKVPITTKVAKYAKEQLGQKYVWGATGPSTFDCSGFTKSVFKCTTGIQIPRVSRDQAKVGTYVEYEELRRGDMVFFDTEKKYTGKVNHVGIYLSDNNFIHASSARKEVIITNFKKKPFYKKRFLWGRRIVQNKS